MPYVSLSDLIANCPNELVANSIIVFDGCNRVLQEIPAGITCEEIVNCIDCTYLLSIITFSTGLIVDAVNCIITVDPNWVNSVITASMDCSGLVPILSIGSQNVDLSCILGLRTMGFHDASNNFWITNTQSVYVVGEDGLRFEALAGILTIGLPGTHTNGQVLTWDATNNTSYRANITTLCCDRVYDCMEPIIGMLQNQINILAQQLCPCGGDGTGAYIDIYEEGALVHANVSQLNFVGPCLTATWNVGTSQADVTLDLGVSFGGCVVQEDGTIEAILSICGTDIDLSCLAMNPMIQVFDEGLFVHDTLQFNFIGDCLIAAWNTLTNAIDVTLDLGIERTDCEGHNTAIWTGTLPGTTTPVTITANGVGVYGAILTLIFPGGVSLNDIFATYNARGIGISYVVSAGDGTQIPTASTITLTPDLIVNPYLLTICGVKIDLSCLAFLPGLSIAEEGALVSNNVTLINFVGPCITASYMSTGIVNVEFNPTITRGGCTGPYPYVLDICGTSVDLSCLVDTAIPVENMAFVMKNGNDTTALIERLDLPFLTIDAAIVACAAASKPMTVYVYAGEYDERITPYNLIDIHLCSNATMGGLDVKRSVKMKVTGDGNIRIPATTTHGVLYRYPEVNNCDITVEVETIFVETNLVRLIDLVTERPTGNQRCRVASKYVYMKATDDSIIPTRGLLLADDQHQIDMSRGTIEVNQPKIAQLVMYNITGGVGATGKLPIAVYHHHTKIQQSPRVYALANNGVAKYWKANNLVLDNTELYQDNIYIEGPFTSESTAYANSFIYSLGENICIVNNDILWKLSSGDTTLIGNRIFNVQNSAVTPTVHCYNRGQNVLHGTAVYDTCFYSVAAVAVYHVGGWTFSNLPSTVAALSSNVFAGVNHLVQDANVGTELFHPYGSH